jgi:membrane-associated phospholipid phosphatase
VTPALVRADRAALRLLRTRLHAPALERGALAYTAVGEFGAVWIAAALAGAARDPGRRRSWLGAAALVPASLGANFVVKLAARRKRPFLDGLPPLGRRPATYSFPSGHAATSFAAALAIGALVPEARAALVAAAVLMALTRPYLGLHYPSDALAGAALGSVLAKLLATAR